MEQMLSFEFRKGLLYILEITLSGISLTDAKDHILLDVLSQDMTYNIHSNFTFFHIIEDIKPEFETHLLICSKIGANTCVCCLTKAEHMELRKIQKILILIYGNGRFTMNCGNFAHVKSFHCHFQAGKSLSETTHIQKEDVSKAKATTKQCSNKETTPEELQFTEVANNI